MILARDVELCPGPALKCFICSKTVRRNQKSDECSECNRLCHVKCLVDMDVYGCEMLFCSTSALPAQSTAEPYINDDLIYERLKVLAKMQGLKIIHQNINGLMRKLGMVGILLKETDRAIDIFAITETHLSRDIKDRELTLDNYTFVKKDRETGIGGGVGCFIREDIKRQRRIDLESAGLETLWLEIFVKNSKSLLICILYRLPNSSKHLHKDFESILQDMLSTGVCEDKETILNVDYL